MLNRDLRRKSCLSLGSLFLLGRIGRILAQSSYANCNLGSLVFDTGGHLAQYLAEDAGQPGLFYGNATQFVQAQFYHANVNQTLPAFQLLNLGETKERYEMRSCAPEDVHKCMTYGNSSNGLPASLQGVWWFYGITWPEVMFSSAGEWYPELRLLRIPTFGHRTWGFEASSSEPDGCWYTESSATQANFFTAMQNMMEVYFNEDLTQAQILAVLHPPYAMGRPIPMPPAMTNWTLFAMPDTQWRRRSWTSGQIDLPCGNYLWKQIVDGKGQPGPAYKEWVAARAGKPFYYLVKAGDP